MKTLTLSTQTTTQGEDGQITGFTAKVKVPTYSGEQEFTLHVDLQEDNEQTWVTFDYPADCLDPDAQPPEGGFIQFHLGTPDE